MANRIPRVPVREQDPKVRATNFEEVCYGYNVEEAQLEASRWIREGVPRFPKGQRDEIHGIDRNDDQLAANRPACQHRPPGPSAERAPETAKAPPSRRLSAKAGIPSKLLDPAQARRPLALSRRGDSPTSGLEGSAVPLGIKLPSTRNSSAHPQHHARNFRLCIAVSTFCNLFSIVHCRNPQQHEHR